MSYDLYFEFHSPVKMPTIIDYFSTRRSYQISGNEFIYKNKETGVYFAFRFTENGKKIFRKSLINGHFNINYCRPSFFGLEAQQELSSIVAALPCKIHDPQMHGMENGPYTNEGFLRGWNFGNRFAVQAILSQSKHKIWSLPTARLHETWRWNYELPARSAQYGERQFLPRIMYFGISHAAQTVIVWGDGLPAFLPKVDFVLMGRSENETPSFSLTAWKTLTDLLQSIGYREEISGFNLDYSITPDAILSFIKNMTPTEKSALTRIPADDIFDEELIRDIPNSGRDLSGQTAIE
ncbi:hypothetical protein [Methylobacterium sp. J-070]|uniref:hypothetical protein n=1 Tax=Methylobacterium sp. J-070 TaxID=2836650 RepID=UPI001FBAC6DC|nr:hypothetical protein [Methylobacterium sp. J-070]MCJ2052207.1 hypothetical protein [Methylobacterium sp. J-070]